MRTLERGATVLPDGSTRFSVWAPRVERLAVRVGSPGREREVPLARDGDGVFVAVVEGIAAGADYFYRLEGERDRPDPASRFQPRGVHGPSRIVDPGVFRWSDEGWKGLEMADLVLYELHVGTFTPEGTFEAVGDRLGELRELGVTAIEILPVAEFPGGRNWGYDGAHLYAPQSTYGGPQGLRRLVDAAHAAGLGVVLDVVYNHLGPEGNYLGEYGPYFTSRYRTPWGRAINFDGRESDEVRRYFVDNAVAWVREFHVDGLRLDAVHAIYDFGARHILEEVAAEVHDEAARSGRRALVIAESDLNDPRLLRPRDRGGYGLDGQWADDFHHAVHAALTDERQGYYVDFGGIRPVAQAIRDRFVLDGRRSAFRGRRHGAPAVDVPADRFVVFVQNHDQVGNRARGDRLSTLVSAEQLKLATALLLLSPYVPMLFMGEEYGEKNPFLYFTSHGDRALGEAVRDGRRKEFARFAWQGEVPDPQSEETFVRSRLDWARRAEPGHARLLGCTRDLLRIRREEPALRPGAADLEVASAPSEEGGRWILVEYALDGALELVSVFNFGTEPLERCLPEHAGREWTTRFRSDLGRAVDEPLVFPNRFVLAPTSAALFKRVSPTASAG